LAMFTKQTDRLVLRDFAKEDGPFVLYLLNTPSWQRFIGDRGVRTLVDAERYIAGTLMSPYAQGLGMYLVETRQSGEPVGMCGLVRRDYLSYPDIGFAFLPQHMGKGYAFEAASAVIAHAAEISMKRIHAITLPGNVASIGLIEKLGLQFEERRAISGETLSIYGKTLQ
ncbi:MAG TPA: GNAT family N-acetyltransferase, partial [Flavisolibacter sp.]|nr:GNAT family N-acetyltransferase [Flavisolibacter sp.]